MPSMHYREYYIPVGKSKSYQPEINLERRSKYALLRAAGISSYQAIRQRDWHWKDVLQLLDVVEYSNGKT